MPIKIVRRFAATSIALLLMAHDLSVCAAATNDSKTKDVYGNTVTAAEQPAIAPTEPGVKTGERGPLIEVSVDSLEISETNASQIGLIWGQLVPTQNGPPVFDANRVNFLEASVPAIFDAGKLNRNLLSAQLSALIRNNQVRILANPTLVTKSGFEATFLVGGEQPYPTPAPLGQAPGIEFKKFGVALKILPTITPRNTIDAVISVGVSDLDFSKAVTVLGTTVPGLTTREANSKVEVTDGETVVLAGIKQSHRTKVVTKVPILGSIPLIGLLFRHKDEQVDQTSVVLFVTFRYIKT